MYILRAQPRIGTNVKYYNDEDTNIEAIFKNQEFCLMLFPFWKKKTLKSLSSSSSIYIPAPSPLNIMGLGALRLAPHTHTLAF